VGIRDQRPYYDDSDCRQFTANVVRVEQADEGADGNAQWHVRLNCTYFYPTSGGQPHDTGRIANARVCDVFVADDQSIVHVTDQPLPVGAAVACEIDAQRRLDHMQQHTGQHIISACFEQMFNVDTVGFHLGQTDVTIDLDTADISANDLRRVEQFANEVVVANYPIRGVFIDASALPQYRLRQAPKVSADIRIVQIEGFDDNACGGTHVRQTGQVGLVKFLRTERVRNGVRLTFVCGFRALHRFEQVLETQRALSNILTTGPDGLVEVVAKVRDESIRTRKALADVKQRLITADVKAWMAAAEPLVTRAGTRVFSLFVGEVEGPTDMKAYVLAIASHLDGNQDAVIACVGHTADRVHIQAERTTGSLFNVRDWLQNTLTSVGFKGGGSEKSAQGSVAQTNADGAQVHAAIREAVSNDHLT